jgi:hypothetical protein
MNLLPQETRPRAQSYIAPGTCHCGCGAIPPIIPFSCARRGLVRGQRYRYIYGHNRRLSPIEYLVCDCGYKTPCWIWQRGLNTRGYGLAADGNRRRRGAHIVYWERENGPVPKGKELDHLCREIRCCNPEHLEPVTHTVNAQRGLVAKLTPELVVEMRGLRDSGMSFVDLGIRYGMNPKNISKAYRRHTWANVV